MTNRFEKLSQPETVPGLDDAMRQRRQDRMTEAQRLQRQRDYFARVPEWGVLSESQQTWFRRQAHRRRARSRLAQRAAGEEVVGDTTESEDDEGSSAAPKVMVQLVATGARHMAVISSRGAVYTWGCDVEGCLGRQINAAFVFKAPPRAGAAFSGTLKANAVMAPDGQAEQERRAEMLRRTLQRTHTAMVGTVGAAAFAPKQYKVRREVKKGVTALTLTTNLRAQLYAMGDGGRLSLSDKPALRAGRPEWMEEPESATTGALARRRARASQASVASVASAAGSIAVGPRRRRSVRSTRSNYLEAAEAVDLKPGWMMGPHGMPIKPRRYVVESELAPPGEFEDRSRMQRRAMKFNPYERSQLEMRAGNGLAPMPPERAEDESDDEVDKGDWLKPPAVPSMVEWMAERDAKPPLPEMEWGDLSVHRSRDPVQTWKSTAVPGIVDGLNGMYAGRMCWSKFRCVCHVSCVMW